jgi:hypothetical protein
MNDFAYYYNEYMRTECQYVQEFLLLEAMAILADEFNK